MSRIKVNTATNKLATGPVNFPDGLTGVAATFTGNVTVGGTLSYEDVQNIDSTGIVTARLGIKIGNPSVSIAATINSGGDIDTIGIITAVNATVSKQLTAEHSNVTGVVTATSYYGDAANMTNAGISAGKAMGLAAFLG